jgi:hypothetical protein
LNLKVNFSTSKDNSNNLKLVYQLIDCDWLSSVFLCYINFVSFILLTIVCVECTLNTLKQAKRFYATAAFDTDTIGLKKAMEKGYFNILFLKTIMTHIHTYTHTHILSPSILNS